jgi:Zn finger protein HypA/HybF involved in hydrogenase expression
MVFKKSTKKPLKIKQIETTNIYYIDCTNCLYYAQVKTREIICPKCKCNLHLKIILY